MYIGYFKNHTGQYHTRIYMDNEDAALALLFTYKAVVPEIIITDSGDAIISKSERGVITYPQFDAHASRYLSEQYPESVLPGFDDVTALESYVRGTVAELLRMRECPQRQQGLINLMALAANHDLNLYRYGYRPVDIRFNPQGQQVC